MTGERVVRRIDHVVMAVDDAQRVFDLLRHRLGLVVMSPVMKIPQEVAGYPVTSWLNLGNIPLEVLELPDELKAPPGTLEVSGIVLEPEPIESAVQELDRRGIPHSPPLKLLHPEDNELRLPDLPFGPERAPQPGDVHGTQLWLNGFLGGKAWVLCYEWVSTPISAVREGLRRTLDEIPDRALPIDSVEEVVIATTDFDGERARWQALLDPVTDEDPGLWRFADGPALRLVEHERDGILGLVLRVADLNRAERYLTENDMLASSSGGELVVTPDALEGLNLTLVG